MKNIKGRRKSDGKKKLQRQKKVQVSEMETGKEDTKLDQASGKGDTAPPTHVIGNT